MDAASPVTAVYVTADTDRASEASTQLPAAGNLSVEICESVSEAIARIRSGEIECIVSDHDLPDIDSIAFLQIVRGQFPDLPFIIFTGEGSEATASKALSAGATDYLIAEPETDQWGKVATLVENAVEYYRSQSGLVESEARARTILEASPDMLCVVQDGVVEYVNRAGVELLDAGSVTALTGRPFPELLSEADRDRVTDALAAVRNETREIARRRGTAVGLGGTTVSVELSISRLEWGGEPALIVVAQDLTDEEGRRILFERFHRAVNAAGHAVFITDVDGTIIYANPAFERITGYTAAEAINETPTLLKSGHHDEPYYRDLWETITAGEVWEDEVVNQRKDGDLYYAHQTIAPVTDDENDIREFIAIQTDITDRKERTKQLGVLSRVLRHNVHNDVNVILGNAELITEQTDGEIAAAADAIIERANQLLQTADKERDIVEILSEQREVETIDLGRLLPGIVDRLATTYDTDVTLTVPEEIHVRAIPEVGVALSEIVENAIVHNDGSDPTVEVAVARENGTVVIRVLDDGPTIPAPERQVLTKQAEIEPLYHGSGLGLWLVNWIVTRSNGQLRFGENDPRGNVVTIELAAAPDG